MNPLTDSTTSACTNPDLETIEKLRDAIMTVCSQRRALEKRREAMGQELAELLCPFIKGETVRLPNPVGYIGHGEGILNSVRLNLDYGYQM